MIIQGEKFSGTFISRPNRFLALVRISGMEVPCYLPDPGRLKELLFPGAEAVVRKPEDREPSPPSAEISIQRRDRSEMRRGEGKHRKTEYDMLAAVIGTNGIQRKLVSVDTRLPNKLVHEALLNNSLREFEGYSKLTPEFRYGSSRLDFLLEKGNGTETGKCYLEVKSCSLVVKGVALFPDAPTERGSRHLRELMNAKSESRNYRACIMFIIQRDDARSLRPNEKTDLKFAQTLHMALSKGVEAFAYTVNFDENSMTLAQSIPIKG